MADRTAGRDFVVTSGTGSGKSLTYLATIFNEVLRNGEAKGIQALIVYPTNALINSQTVEIEKYRALYEEATGRPCPIRSAQYTGQEGKDAREAVLRDEPPREGATQEAGPRSVAATSGGRRSG